MPIFEYRHLSSQRSSRNSLYRCQQNFSYELEIFSHYGPTGNQLNDIEKPRPIKYKYRVAERKKTETCKYRYRESFFNTNSDSKVSDKTHFQKTPKMS